MAGKTTHTGTHHLIDRAKVYQGCHNKGTNKNKGTKKSRSAMFFSRFIQEQSAKPLNKKDHLSQFTSLLWKQIIYIYNYNISIYLSIHLSIYLDIATSFLIGEPSTFMGHPYHSYITTLRKLHPQPKGRCKALRCRKRRRCGWITLENL